MPYPPRAIVLTFDRLSRRCLSFYGHEWIEAPNLERLAARSVVFDQHFGTAAEMLGHRDGFADLESRLQEAGIEATQLVEDPVSAASPSLDAPNESVQDSILSEQDSAGSNSTQSDATDLEATSLARMMVEADQALTDFALKPDASWLLWLKSAGIAWPCVATEEFAELYADEINGEQGELADDIKLAEVAYAACVTQLDHLVGRLLATIERLFPQNPPLLIVAALAGESLGELEPLPLEHVDTSPSPETWKLRDEMIHTLLLVSHPANGSVGSRRQELVQASDLRPTLLDWFANDAQQASAEHGEFRTPVTEVGVRFNDRSLLPLVRNAEFACREAVFLCDDEGHAAMRTREFLLIERDAAELRRSETNTDRIDATGFSCQLFLKPEDVWEINDVAEQHPEQVVSMREAIRTWLRGHDAR